MLNCPGLIRENQFVSNTTDRKYFPIDIKLNEVQYKLQNSIYLLTCRHCDIQCAGESITPLNLKLDIPRKTKAECEVSVDHKNATFSIQVTEELPGNGYKTVIKDNAWLKYRLQHEDYWMKTLYTVCPYVLNDNKFINKHTFIGRLSPPLPTYVKRFIDTRTRPKITNHDISSEVEIFFNFLK